MFVGLNKIWYNTRVTKDGIYNKYYKKKNL